MFHKSPFQLLGFKACHDVWTIALLSSNKLIEPGARVQQWRMGSKQAVILPFYKNKGGEHEQVVPWH